MSEVRIAAEPRTEFGKGAARRTRRAGKVPAVLYGHGTPPQHISLPGHDLMLALKTPNALLRVQGLADGDALALPKEVQRDPLKGFLEHVDLLIVKRGEKVEVDIPLQLIGTIAPGGMLDQQLVQITVECDATRIPQSVEVEVEGMEIGDSVHAGDLKLPGGVTLVADPEALVLHVLDVQKSVEPEEPAAEEVEGEEAEEAAEGEQPREEPAE